MKLLPRKLRDTEALKKTADGFREQLEAAEKISDTTDRFEALLALQKSTARHASDVLDACINRSVNVEVASTIGTLVSGVGGGVAVIVLVNPIVGLAVLLGGVAAGITLGVKGVITDKLYSGMQNALKEHLTSLNATLETTGKDIGDLLQNKSNEIAASEKFGGLYDRYPGIRDSFIKNFNQAFARNQLPPPPNPAPKLAL